MAQGGSQPQETLLGTVPKGTQEPAGGSWGHPLPCLGVGGASADAPKGPGGHLRLCPGGSEGGTQGCTQGHWEGAQSCAPGS